MPVDRTSRSRLLGLVGGRSKAGNRAGRRKNGRDSPKRAGKRPRSWRRGLLKLLLGLLLIWLVGCYLVVAEPTVNKPAKVDAILVLGPPDVDGRAQAAYALARAHYASTVVVSVGAAKQLRTRTACRNQDPAFQVICFSPEPATTQGEAEEIGRLARQHGWKSVIVVTSKYHISRARLIVERCLPGKVLMVAAPGKPSVTKWAYEFAYQSGAYLKAFRHPGC